ncbi:hypothetical protein OG792_32750 [Micromonospora sp. NBC_01699]|uniref:hypothetical protein n=1 Tax=Micromonospora sp. NBC_01699 TaxID=2975984 RepID=UPI002E2CC58C|nr:hypothetical protein [Micromonospora sp. NBC_01699]
MTAFVVKTFIVVVLALHTLAAVLQLAKDGDDRPDEYAVAFVIAFYTACALGVLVFWEVPA